MNVTHRGGRLPWKRLWFGVPAIAAVVTVLAASPSSADTGSGGTGTAPPGSVRSYAPNLPVLQRANAPTPTPSDPAPQASASPAHAPVAASKASASSAPCPPPPPQHSDSKDHGYFKVKIAKQPHSQYQVTLTFYCYDKDEPQHANVSFVGHAPTGDGKQVKVLSGDTSFTFIGHKSTATVDAQKTYLLDPTVLGAPASDGWHIRINVPITPDNSASRSALVVLPTGPSVQPTQSLHVPIPKATVQAVRLSLPQTGGAPLPEFVSISVLAIVLGLYLCYLAATPRREPYQRRH